MPRILHTENHIIMDATADVVFQLAADITRWPELLAHYRYVRIVEDNTPSPAEMTGRIARMSAARGCIPVSWTSLQLLDAARARIIYHHTGGITRGMDVEWRIEPCRAKCRVTIRHHLTDPGRLLRLPFARHIAGRYFISPIADRTLAGIKAHAEKDCPGPQAV